MRKVIGKLLALSAVLVLTSCGGKDKKASSGENESVDKEANIKISVQLEEDWMEHYKAAAERVKKEFPNAEIELRTIGGLEHIEIIDSTDANNEDVADLFCIPADRLAGLVGNEVLGAIDSQKLADEIGGWDDFDSGLGGEFKVDGEYFAFPYNIETLITYVNTANAKEKGIDLEKDIEINDVKDESTVLFPAFDAWYGVAATNSSNIELLGKNEDGTFFSDMTKEWDELDESQQATIKGLYEYWKKHNEAGTQLFDPDAGWGYVDETFKPGNGGVARLGGAWDAQAISKQAGEGNLAIYPMEKLTLAGKALAHWQSGWGLAINARLEEYAEKKALAEAMIKELVNPEYAEDLYKYSGKILENVSAEEYQNSKLDQIDKDIIEATIDSYKKAPSRPLFKEWGDVWDTYSNAVLSWNSVNPQNEEEAYKALKASFESMMANFK